MANRNWARELLQARQLTEAEQEWQNYQNFMARGGTTGGFQMQPVGVRPPTLPTLPVAQQTTALPAARPVMPTPAPAPAATPTGVLTGAVTPQNTVQEMQGRVRDIIAAQSAQHAGNLATLQQGMGGLNQEMLQNLQDLQGNQQMYQTQLANLLSQVVAGQQENRQQITADRGRLENMLTPEFMTQLINNAMAAYRPMFEQGQADLRLQHQENVDNLLATADRRGILASGFNMAQERQLAEGLQRAIADLYGNLLGRAGDNAQAFLNQQLQGADMLGGMTQAQFDNIMQGLGAQRDIHGNVYGAQRDLFDARQQTVGARGENLGMLFDAGRQVAGDTANLQLTGAEMEREMYRDAVGDQRWATEFGFNALRAAIGDQRWEREFALEQDATEADVIHRGALLQLEQDKLDFERQLRAGEITDAEQAARIQANAEKRVALIDLKSILGEVPSVKTVQQARDWIQNEMEAGIITPEARDYLYNNLRTIARTISYPALPPREQRATTARQKAEDMIVFEQNPDEFRFQRGFDPSRTDIWTMLKSVTPLAVVELTSDAVQTWIHIPAIQREMAAGTFQYWRDR